MLSDQSLNPSNQPTSRICFSFTSNLNQCIEIKKKNFLFTNRVPLKKLREYRATIDKALCDWSAKTIPSLKSEGVCYPVKKAKVNEIRNNIAKVFQVAGYHEEWIKQNILDPDIYKFKVNK